MEKLSFTNFRNKVRYHVNKNLNPFSIKEVVKLYDKGKVDFDVYLPTKGINLQRGFVWTVEQKSEYIKSVLKECDNTKFSLIHVDHEMYQVIDGKQRLITLIEFVKGVFPIKFDKKDYFFDDLDDTCQHDIRLFYPKADVAYSYTDMKDHTPITDDEKIEWFLRVNFSGTPQDEIHHENLKSCFNK
jgi:hypothetical protein